MAMKSSKFDIDEISEILLDFMNDFKAGNSAVNGNLHKSPNAYRVYLYDKWLKLLLKKTKDQPIECSEVIIESFNEWEINLDWLEIIKSILACEKWKCQVKACCFECDKTNADEIIESCKVEEKKANIGFILNVLLNIAMEPALKDDLKKSAFRRLFCSSKMLASVLQFREYLCLDFPLNKFISMFYPQDLRSLSQILHQIYYPESIIVNFKLHLVQICKLAQLTGDLSELLLLVDNQSDLSGFLSQNLFVDSDDIRYETDKIWEDFLFSSPKLNSSDEVSRVCNEWTKFRKSSADSMMFLNAIPKRVFIKNFEKFSKVYLFSNDLSSLRFACSFFKWFSDFSAEDRLAYYTFQTICRYQHDIIAQLAQIYCKAHLSNNDNADKSTLNNEISENEIKNMIQDISGIVFKAIKSLEKTAQDNQNQQQIFWQDFSLINSISIDHSDGDDNNITSTFPLSEAIYSGEILSLSLKQKP